MDACQNCGKPATQHFTKIVQGKKHVTNLCAACAEQQNLIKDQDLIISQILHNVIGQHMGPTSEELARLTCPTCGIKYMEFKAEGRLGCPNDYKIFQNALEPLLERIHRSKRHVGKIPPHATKNADTQRDLM